MSGTSIPVEQQLRETSTSDLLKAAFHLTHRMHVLTSMCTERSLAKASELRSQRDLVSAEIERRCAPAQQPLRDLAMSYAKGMTGSQYGIKRLREALRAVGSARVTEIPADRLEEFLRRIGA